MSDSDIEEMFSYADADKDGKINWTEFQTMINPPHCRAETGNIKKAVTGKKVTIHPHSLSVSGILKNSGRVAPLEISETHVSASWSEIGLQQPTITNNTRVGVVKY